MIPTRHFAGRAPPTPPSSDSDSDAKPPAEPVPKPPQRRRRFVARVITPGADAQPLDLSAAPGEEKKGEERSTSSGFVPVSELEKRASAIDLTPRETTPIAHSLEPEKQETQSLKSESESSSSSDSGEEESESEPEPEPEEPAFRPVFIKPKPKSAPAPTHDREEARAKERREEAQKMVSDALNEEESVRRARRDESLPDDTDRPEDREREHALWRVRELRRIKRDRDEEKAWAERAKRGARGEEGGGEKEAGASVETRPRSKLGPFFLERGVDGRFTEEIYNREMSRDGGGMSGLRVGRDRGRAGRTKFAGLAQEDTAGERARELRRDKELREKLTAHAANRST